MVSKEKITIYKKCIERTSVFGKDNVTPENPNGEIPTGKTGFFTGNIEFK